MWAVGTCTASRWSCLVFNSLGEEERGFAQEVLSLDFHAEIQWLSRVLPLINSPVVFCHNDLNGGNLLQRTQLWNKTDNDCGGAGGLVAIDFEFCAYNYRAYDIANHWNEWIYDYGNKEYPYYFVDSSKAPSMEQKTIFLRGYLQVKFTFYSIYSQRFCRCIFSNFLSI